jgi:hypothetical protein
MRMSRKPAPGEPAAPAAGQGGDKADG